MRVEIGENEDFGPEWRRKKKHLFIFSSAGKPIYSRYGRSIGSDLIFTVLRNSVGVCF